MNKELSSARTPVTLFILNWNRREELRMALQGLQHQTHAPAEILVADSGSTDGAAEMVEAEFPDIRLVRLGGNFGCPGGRNLGIQQARHELVFCMDNDAQLHADAIARALQTMNRDEKVAVVGGVVREFADVSEVDLHCPTEQQDACYGGRFSGGVCLLRKSVFEQLGGYPTHTSYGGEEMHLTLRLWDRGFRVALDPAVILWHARSGECRDEVTEWVNRRISSVLVRTELFPLSTALSNLAYAVAMAPIEAMRRLPPREWLRWAVAWSAKMPSVLRKFVRRSPVARSTVSWYFRSRNARVPVGAAADIGLPQENTKRQTFSHVGNEQ